MNKARLRSVWFLVVLSFVVGALSAVFGAGVYYLASLAGVPVAQAAGTLAAMVCAFAVTTGVLGDD